jgi:hypothetical protein
MQVVLRSRRSTMLNLPCVNYQIEQNTFEFHDKEVERLVTLTPSDRAWMDQVVRSVEDTWNPVSNLRLATCMLAGTHSQIMFTRPIRLGLWVWCEYQQNLDWTSLLMAASQLPRQR